MDVWTFAYRVCWHIISDTHTQYARCCTSSCLASRLHGKSRPAWSYQCKSNWRIFWASITEKVCWDSEWRGYNFTISSMSMPAASLLEFADMRLEIESLPFAFRFVAARGMWITDLNNRNNIIKRRRRYDTNVSSTSSFAMPAEWLECFLERLTRVTLIKNIISQNSCECYLYGSAVTLTKVYHSKNLQLFVTMRYLTYLYLSIYLSICLSVYMRIY